MMKIVKALHIVGVAMFLGSILGHIAVGLAPGADTDPPLMLFARQAIEAATWYVTLPGLALIVASGLFMTVKGKFGFLKRRWLTLHHLAALIIVANAVFVLVPVGRKAMAAAAAVLSGSATPEAFAALTASESMFGALNLLLALAAIFLAAVKPRLGNS